MIRQRRSDFILQSVVLMQKQSVSVQLFQVNVLSVVRAVIQYISIIGITVHE